MIPPPPVFKPTFVQMQKGLTNSNNSSPILTYSNSSNGDVLTSDYNNVNNSNYLTCSFMSNEDYNSNKLLKFSPSISPMTKPNDSADMQNNNNVNNASNNFKMEQPNQTKKRRRSSSINTINSKESIEQKKKELKIQHSIIEKKRRIKMNREFEALKFLIPACRLNILNGLNESFKNFENSNSMHKLTILQSTVEYIKYLHFIIRLIKLKILTNNTTKHDSNDLINWIKDKRNDLNFANFDLDLQNYRKIENEFNFEELFLKIWENNGNMISNNENDDPLIAQINQLINEEEDFDDESTGTSNQNNETAIASNVNSADNNNSESENESESESEDNDNYSEHSHKHKIPRITDPTKLPLTYKYSNYPLSTPPILPQPQSSTTSPKLNSPLISMTESIQSKSPKTSKDVYLSLQSKFELPLPAIKFDPTQSTPSSSSTIPTSTSRSDSFSQAMSHRNSVNSFESTAVNSPLDFTTPSNPASSDSTHLKTMTSDAITTRSDNPKDSSNYEANSLTELNATKGLILLKDDNSRRTSIESLLN